MPNRAAPRLAASIRLARLRAYWRSILARCESKRHNLYAGYGAKGVRVCREWHAPEEFIRWANEQGYATGQSLLLRDRSRGYRPDNCSWATRSEAIRVGILNGPTGHSWGLTAFGETKSLLAWSRDLRCTVTSEGLRARLDRGMSPEMALAAGKHVRFGTAPGAKRVRARKRKKRQVAIDWDRALELFDQRGLSPAEIAQSVGASYHGVLRGLRSRGRELERRAPAVELPGGVLIYKLWASMRRRVRESSGQGRLRMDPSWRQFRPFYDWAQRQRWRPGLSVVPRRGERVFGPNTAELVEHIEVLHRAKRGPPSRIGRVFVEAFGERKSLMEWSTDPRCNVSVTGLRLRLLSGMKPALAITKPSNRFMTKARTSFSAFGETKGITAWSRDRRCKVCLASLRDRVNAGVPLEVALRTPAFALRT
jgi:hypothetical protein